MFDALEASSGDELLRSEPVVVVLHGEEAKFFTHHTYNLNRTLVDRAALLDAYKVIDVRMCESWMSENNVKKSDVLPFIDTVPYAPEEIDQLKANGYRSYPSMQM